MRLRRRRMIPDEISHIQYYFYELSLNIYMKKTNIGILYTECLFLVTIPDEVSLPTDKREREGSSQKHDYEAANETKWSSGENVDCMYCLNLEFGKIHILYIKDGYTFKSIVCASKK